MPKRAGRPKGSKDAFLTVRQQREALAELRRRADAGDAVALGVVLAISRLMPNRVRTRGGADDRDCAIV